MHDVAADPGSSGLVLVAEDNSVNQRVATAMLRDLGYHVDVVADGSEAVEAATSTPYRAILMDRQLPVMDGLQATIAIRADEGSTRHTLIVAVTASASEEDHQRCLAAGMDDYLAKPLSLRSLGAVLDRWPQDGTGPIALADPVEADPEPTVSPLIRPPAPTLDPSVVDRLERLGKAAGDDLLGQLTTMFLADAARSVIALHAALEDDDAATVSASAHGLRGASANLGATELARLCAILSAAAAAGELAEGDATLDAIEAELARVREALPHVAKP